MYTVLQRIYAALGYEETKLLADIADGFMLSVDVAHGVHPNVPEKSDVTNKVIIGKGVTFKISASQSYANDCHAVGAMMQLCDQHNVAYQKFVNRSDGTSGSTLGSISSTGVTMRTLDIGIALLAMHSARELMGCKDQDYLEVMFRYFFK